MHYLHRPQHSGTLAANLFSIQCSYQLFSEHSLMPLLGLQTFLLVLGFLLLQLLAPNAVRSDLFSVPQKDERDDPHSNRQKSEQTASPRNAECVVHWSSSEWQNDSEDTSRARGGSKCTGRKRLVSVDDIVNQGHEDQQKTNSKRQRREYRHDYGEVGWLAYVSSIVEPRQDFEPCSLPSMLRFAHSNEPEASRSKQARTG